MINLRPAKSIQGKITLPVSPDLLFMAALGACAAGRCVRVGGVSRSDVVDDIVRSLSGHAAIELSGGALSISPKSNGGGDPALLLSLPDSLIPYRVIYLFMGLGMGKTVAMKSATQMQLLDFTAQAKRVGVTVEPVNIDRAEAVGLRAAYFDNGIAEGSCPSEDDCAALLAFLFGKRERLTFSIVDYSLSTPLRKLAGAFGFALSAKLCATEGEEGLMSKRMRFLQGRQRSASTQSQTFSVDPDFPGGVGNAGGHGDGEPIGGVNASERVAGGDDENVNASENVAGGSGGDCGKQARCADTAAVLDIAVPGDEILAAALIAAKTLVSKGDLELTNVPLESWAMQTISFVKKMGGKINAKENSKTAFGNAGSVTIQKSEYAGRKIRCIPMYQFLGHLPSITVAAAFADGKSIFRDMAALRLFEPDGIGQLEQSLRPLGVRHGEMPDGIVVEGAKEFDGFDMPEALPAHIAAAFCAAGLRCVGKTSVADDFIVARWPEFEKLINEICEFRNK
ncbi:MAG: hypothetical protein LBH93_08630 [Chitinispirillales bacterium]|jgi:hypothetical protein|nr:hypothetical protein [Chitinispirillales bacterium]